MNFSRLVRISAAAMMCITMPHMGFAEDQPSYTFKGTVQATTGTNAGAAGLTVSLTPPTKLNKPKLVANTDDQGRFVFRNIERGEYLLEVFQRLTILYRQVINVPEILEKDIRLSPDLDALVEQIDLSDTQARLKPVNTLAFDGHYPTPDVVSAILQRLENESVTPLSTQGEINALVILARRARDPWLQDQITRAKQILERFNQKQDELNAGQRWAVAELSSALGHISASETTSMSQPRAVVGTEGFCYLGKFAKNTWETKYIKFGEDHLPSKGESGVVSYPIPLRDEASNDARQFSIAQAGQKLRVNELIKREPDLYWAKVVVIE